MGQLVGAVLLALGLPLLLGLLGTGTLNLLEGVLTDGGVSVAVELLDLASLNAVLDVLAELAVVALLIIIGKTLHVLGDVTTVDVLAEGIDVELLSLLVVAGEAALGVGDEDTTVGGTLHGGEDTGTGGGTGKTDIKENLEGTAGALVGLGGLSDGVLAISLLDTGELLVKAELLQGTAGKEQTGGVGGSPVGQTVLDAIGLELVGVGGGENLVTGELRVDDLGDDVAVGEADHQAVLGGVVLVLGLGDQTLTGVVISLSLTATAVLGLVAAILKLACVAVENSSFFLEKCLPEVRAALDKLVEGLQYEHSSQQFALQNFSSEASCKDPFPALGKIPVEP